MHRIQGDMLDIELPATGFDAITAIYSLFHCPSAEHPGLFASMHRWRRPGGLVLFTYATRDYTGQDNFAEYKEFMGQSLYYSHITPEALATQLQQAGLIVEQVVKRSIGGETFLWVTAWRP